MCGLKRLSTRVWLDRFFASYYARRPVNATFIGVHDHDGRLPDFSENGTSDTTLERREAYEVAGTDGSLTVPVAFLPGVQDTVIEERRGRGELIRHSTPGDDEYRLMVEHFADCVMKDLPLRYDALEAAANMRAIEALYRSARDGGRPVRLSHAF